MITFVIQEQCILYEKAYTTKHKSVKKLKLPFHPLKGFYVMLSLKQLGWGVKRFTNTSSSSPSKFHLQEESWQLHVGISRLSNTAFLCYCLFYVNQIMSSSLWFIEPRGSWMSCSSRLLIRAWAGVWGMVHPGSWHSSISPSHSLFPTHIHFSSV